MMIWSMDRCNTLRRVAAQAALLIVTGLLASGLAASVVVAQEQPAVPKASQQPKAKTQPAPAPAGGAQAPAAAGVNQNAWTKVCEKSKQTENKELCRIFHERLDGNSGMLLVAVAVRKIEDDDKGQFIVRLTTAIALAIPDGVHVRIDEGDPIKLAYTLCIATTCQAEIPLTPELLASIRKGKQLMVAVVNMLNKTIGFPMPLTGFSKAYDGPPVDNVKYQQARRQLMEATRKRQGELANKAAEAQRKKEQQGAQPQAGAQAPAQPAPNATAQQKKPAASAPQ